MNKLRKYTPLVLFAGYIILFISLAIHPYDRAVWWAENIPIFLLFSGIVILYLRNIRFSPLAYIMMFCLLYIHTIGGFYTFERVPFDWFNNFFGFERNMYDRVGHFTVGFYAYPFLEYLWYRTITPKKLAILFSICLIATVAVSYEWLEWWYAVKYGGSAGVAFLGSQGDVWDAQKDMLMDTIGAVFAVIPFVLINRKSKVTTQDSKPVL